MNGTKNEEVKKEYSGRRVLIYLLIVICGILACIFAYRENFYLCVFIAFAGGLLGSWEGRERFLLKKECDK
ncbi:MAG: hypothetical protein J5684_06285 [Eubacterium sp.]|nr:hypothetical protein [Eubacterium sp.]